MAFGERMRSLRLQHGLTQDELAVKSGISRVSVGFYERGERIPPTDIAAAIAKVLNTSIDYMLSGRGSPRPSQEDQERFEEMIGYMESSGFTVFQTTSNFAEWHLINDERGISVTMREAELEKILFQVLNDAEARKELYIKNRLFVEFS